MRDIEFRGMTIGKSWVDMKTGEGGKSFPEWVYGYLVIDGSGCVKIHNKSFIDGCEVRYETVGQYTGFKDKKERKIYEGDIVEFRDLGEDGYEYLEGYDFLNRAVIVWDNGRFELGSFLDSNSGVLDAMDSEPHECFIGELMDSIEIVGNMTESRGALRG